jgi:hypothetical protein
MPHKCEQHGRERKKKREEEEHNGAHVRTVHPPELDGTIIGSRNDKRQGRVESGPVDASVVPLQHVLNHHVGIAEEIVLGKTKRVVEPTRWRDVLLLEPYAADRELEEQKKKEEEEGNERVSHEEGGGPLPKGASLPQFGERKWERT